MSRVPILWLLGLTGCSSGARGPVGDAGVQAADDAMALAGAELVVGRGWLGIRAHPEPSTTISFGGSAIPPWVDRCLREAVGGGTGA